MGRIINMDYKKIKTYEISRSYDRKVKFGDAYEMAGVFSNHKAIVENPNEKELEEITEELYRKASQEVDIKVEILQNPGKVLRGFATIEELRKLVKAQEIEIQKLKLKDNSKPF